MRPRTKVLVAVLSVVVLAATPLAGTAGARGLTDTEVTIKEESGDFSGRIKTSRPHQCADGRKVKLMKQEGRNQRPHSDEKVASDTAELRRDHGVWNTGNTGFNRGKYYAYAPKTENCAGDTSETVHV